MGKSKGGGGNKGKKGGGGKHTSQRNPPGSRQQHGPSGKAKNQPPVVVQPPAVIPPAVIPPAQTTGPVPQAPGDGRSSPHSQETVSAANVTIDSGHTEDAAQTPVLKDDASTAHTQDDIDDDLGDQAPPGDTVQNTSPPKSTTNPPVLPTIQEHDASSDSKKAPPNVSGTTEGPTEGHKATGPNLKQPPQPTRETPTPTDTQVHGDQGQDDIDDTSLTSRRSQSSLTRITQGSVHLLSSAVKGTGNLLGLRPKKKKQGTPTEIQFEAGPNQDDPSALGTSGVHTAGASPATTGQHKTDTSQEAGESAYLPNAGDNTGQTGPPNDDESRSHGGDTSSEESRTQASRAEKALQAVDAAQKEYINAQLDNMYIAYGAPYQFVAYRIQALMTDDFLTRTNSTFPFEQWAGLMAATWRKSDFQNEWEHVCYLGKNAFLRDKYKKSIKEEFERKLTIINVPLDSPSMPFYILIRTYMVHLPILLGHQLVYLLNRELEGPIDEHLNTDSIMKEADQEYVWALKDHKRNLDAHKSARRHEEMLRYSEQRRAKQVAEDKRRYEEQKIKDEELRRRAAIDLQRRQLRPDEPLPHPDLIPQQRSTHMHGRWVYDPSMGKIDWAWYAKELTVQEVLRITNLPRDKAHWKNRVYPDGRVYDSLNEYEKSRSRSKRTIVGGILNPTDASESAHPPPAEGIMTMDDIRERDQRRGSEASDRQASQTADQDRPNISATTSGSPPTQPRLGSHMVGHHDLSQQATQQRDNRSETSRRQEEQSPPHLQRGGPIVNEHGRFRHQSPTLQVPIDRTIRYEPVHGQNESFGSNVHHGGTTIPSGSTTASMASRSQHTHAWGGPRVYETPKPQRDSQGGFVPPSTSHGLGIPAGSLFGTPDPGLPPRPMVSPSMSRRFQGPGLDYQYGRNTGFGPKHTQASPARDTTFTMGDHSSNGGDSRRSSSAGSPMMPDPGGNTTQRNRRRGGSDDLGGSFGDNRGRPPSFGGGPPDFGGGGDGGDGDRPPSGPPPGGLIGPPRYFKTKPDMKSFKTYNNVAEFPTWIEHMIALARPYGCIQAFNPDYVPVTWGEYYYFWEMNAWLYAVLSIIVKTVTGRPIIYEHRHDFNSQMIIIKLTADARSSTHAIVASGKTLQMLTSIRIDKDWNQSTVKFITKFEEHVRTYNDQQQHPETMISDTMMKTLLQTAVSPIGMLRSVKDKELERLMDGKPPLTYDQYSALLQHQATIYDEGRMRRAGGTRSAFFTNMIEDGEPSNDAIQDDATSPSTEDVTNEIVEYYVNIMKRTSPSAKMNKDTWQSLSTKGQETWDKLEDSDKTKILRYAAKRAGVQANIAESTAPSINVNETAIEPSRDADESTSKDNGEKGDNPIENVQDRISINQAISKAVGEAHPADVRRMMGGGKNGKPKPKMKAMTVNFFGGDSDDDSSVGVPHMSRNLKAEDSDDDSDDYDDMPTMKFEGKDLFDEYWNENGYASSSDSEGETDFRQGGW